MAVDGPTCILLPENVGLSSLPLVVAPSGRYLCLSPAQQSSHHQQRRRPETATSAPPSGCRSSSAAGGVLVPDSDRDRKWNSYAARGRPPQVGACAWGSAGDCRQVAAAGVSGGSLPCIMLDTGPSSSTLPITSRTTMASSPPSRAAAASMAPTGSKRAEAMLEDGEARGGKSRRRTRNPGHLSPPLMTIPSLTLSMVSSKPALGSSPSPPPATVTTASTMDDNSINSLRLAALSNTGSRLLVSCSAASSAPAPSSSSAAGASAGFEGAGMSSSSRSRSAPCSPSLLSSTTGSSILSADTTTSILDTTTSILGSSVLGISPLVGYARGEALPLAERTDSAKLTLLKPGSADLEGSAMKGWPLLFHQSHSDNIQLSLDRRRAKRFESFCKGICFSNRPIAINERVYLKFSEVSTSWSGVVRFGVMSHDPSTINGSELPRYACPDLTNKPGYWAKAVPERFAEQSNTLYFYVTRNGDVMFGLNNEDKGLFFSGVNTSTTLWGLVDIYGNSTSMEFVDGRQLNNLSPSSGVPASDGTLSPELMQAYAALRLQQPSSGLSPGGHSQSMPSLPAAGVGAQSLVVTGGGLPVRYYTTVSFTPMPFHTKLGRNVCLSADRTIAVRLVEEYCNGYVFTSRPLRPGEHMVIQILSVDTAFVGGLAFGMTACDPLHVNPAELPDDSDLLLDRPEYWVVNKDVCSAPVVGDELSFHLTDEGEVRYGKNGHHVATLMHVDKTLPLWAFFDVYGSTQKMKSLGIVSGHLPTSSQHRASIGSGSGLTVALPPRRSSGSPSPSLMSGPAVLATPPSSSTTSTPPPRPPPPRNSPSSRHPHSSALPSRAESPTPPTLPPKQFRPLPAPPPPPGTMLQPTPASLSAVPPAVQLSQPPAPPPPVAPRTLTFTAPSMAVPAPARPTMMQPAMTEMPEAESDEALDNASNECSVCFENAVDCVLYTCGHMCVCYDCAMDIKQNQSALCPICRQVIKDIIKIYRS